MYIHKMRVTRKLLGVMDMSITLIMVMVSWVYVQNHQIVYINSLTTDSQNRGFSE